MDEPSHSVLRGPGGSFAGKSKGVIGRRWDLTEEMSRTPALAAAQLAPLVNGFTINRGPPKNKIIIPGASKLAGLQDVTVTGVLLKKQSIAIDPRTNARTVTEDGTYTIEQDGDLHFCLGTRQLEPHITCELQNAEAWLSKFNQAVGRMVSVSGFFRCLFEHPGFASGDDAHVFEIHPVRAVEIDGQVLPFNVDVPEQKSIHNWTSPHPLNVQDNRITVLSGLGKDTLTFSGMDGKDDNYVRETGTISNVILNVGGAAPATFTFTSSDIGHPIRVYCLQGTTAARQLRQLKKTQVTLVGLRNIDRGEALKGRYEINLLAIDIQ